MLLCHRLQIPARGSLVSHVQNAGGRSFILLVWAHRLIRPSDSERSDRNSNVIGGCLLSVLFHFGNMGKETFPVSHVSEEVAPLFVQMVSPRLSPV